MRLWTNEDLDRVRRGLNTAGRKLRHNIRYACFRMQSEVCEGRTAEPEHHAIAKTIEGLPGFGGWEKFADTWDVSTPDPITLVPRKWSIHQEWLQTMLRVAQPLPGVQDGDEGNV
jgi:hypothetical protein